MPQPNQSKEETKNTFGLNGVIIGMLLYTGEQSIFSIVATHIDTVRKMIKSSLRYILHVFINNNNLLNLINQNKLNNTVIENREDFKIYKKKMCFLVL